MHYYKHPTAVIDEPVSIGAGTQIWLFTHVSAHAQIGEHCIMGQNVYIDKHVHIGNRVKIQNNVSVYTGVTCHDEAFIGPSVVFTNVINPRSFIDRKHAFKETLVGKGASIGANATIVCGVQIGEYAMVGAGAVITKDVLPYAIMKGNPAVFSGWVSKAGLALEFDKSGRAICPESGAVYFLINGQVQPET